MNYLCMVHVDEAMMQALTAEQDREVTRKSLAYDAELKASGHYIASNALKGPETATVIKVRNGKVSMHDGPHVETKEHLGGFILIDARDLNEAISIASKIPMANYGSIEVRPELTLES
jgi:hypothetical protein